MPDTPADQVLVDLWRTGNEEAARLAGINVRLVKLGVYVISGGCAALAGMLLMARFSSGSPQTGVGSELQSIAAVVVGGTSLMGGRGSIDGEALEQSNVDISAEFSDLIVAQRAFEANSKTVTTFDSVTQQAIGMIR